MRAEMKLPQKITVNAGKPGVTGAHTASHGATPTLNETLRKVAKFSAIQGNATKPTHRYPVMRRQLLPQTTAAGAAPGTKSQAGASWGDPS